MINYLQQNIDKLQAGGMPQTGIDPQMLAQMMSAQGAGQGVDYNGEPTPNVSGEPSFADMAQEIQGRYDKLIIPLQNKLEKLKEKLKENPTDQTIKNEIQRLEQRIDQLEQQEDMELQQLEAEVEKSGEMIDQQKQMEGYGNMQNEIPEEEMMPQQSPEMTEQLQGEMPMMQKGGIVPKEQISTAIKNWLLGIGAKFAAPFYESPRSNEHQTTVDDLKRELNQMDEEMPFASRAVRVLPPNAIAQGAIDVMSNDKDRLWEDALLGSAPSFLSAPLTYALGVAGGIGSDIAVGAGLKATTGNDLPSHLKKLGLNNAASDFLGHMIQGAPGGFFGAKLGNFNTNIYRNSPKKKLPIGLDENGIRIGNTIYGPDPNTLSMGFPKIKRTSAGTSSNNSARVETIAQKVKNKYGADWSKIEDLDIYTDRSRAQNEALFNRLENGELEIVSNGNGGHVIREVKKPEVTAEPKFDWENATAKEAFKQRMKLNKTVLDPFWKATNEWNFEPMGKNGEPGALGRNVVKGINWGLSGATRPFSHFTSFLGDATLGSLFHLQRPGFMRNIYTNPTIAGFSNGWKSATGPRKYFSYNWSVPEGIGAKRNTVWKNITTPFMIDAPIIGGALLFNKLHDKNEQLQNEDIEKSAIPVQEQKNVNVDNNDTILYEMIDTTSRIGKRYYNPETDTWYQTGGTIKKHQNDPTISGDTEEKTAKEKWYADFKKDYIANHPVGLPGFLKETPYTEYGVWGNAMGKLIDDSGRRNIEAQNQFRYNSNPYTKVYDRANRDYNDALSMANARYDLRENMLRRMQPVQEYGSLQQAQNARLAQQTLLNQQIAQNENDRNSAIASIQGTYGKNANDAYTSMMEQDYKNTLLNENLRKTYLQSLDTYRKEKQAQFDQLVNMAAITGNRRKQADLFNAEFVPNLFDAAIAGVDYSDLLKFYQQHYPYYIPQKNN